MEFKHLKGRTFLLRADGAKIRMISKVPDHWRLYKDGEWHRIGGEDLIWLFENASDRVKLWILDTEEIMEMLSWALGEGERR